MARVCRFPETLGATWRPESVRASPVWTLKYSRIPLIRTLVVRIGLALPVNIFLLYVSIIIPKKMQQYTVYLYLQTALPVSGGVSTHHQELISLYLQYLALVRPWLDGNCSSHPVNVSIMPDTVDTVIWAPDDGWRYHPKQVQQFADINKLFIVASCWIIIATYYAMLGLLNIISYCNCATSFYGLNPPPPVVKYV